jgi:hypothetical protein
LVLWDGGCEDRVVSPRQVGLLAALSAIWGGSYLLIKYALEDFSAPMIVFVRCLIASLVLLAALRATGGPAAARTAWADLRARPRTAPAARLGRRRGAVHAHHARRARGAVRPHRRC